MSESITNAIGDSQDGGITRKLECRNRNYSMVLWQQGKPIADAELNLVQQIQNNERAEYLRTMYHSGFFTAPKILEKPILEHIKYGENKLVIDGVHALVNGYQINCDDEIVIDMGVAPKKSYISCTGEIGYRNDLVYLEVWFDEISPTDYVYKDGNIAGIKVENDLKDTMFNDETTRRVQCKFAIRVAKDIDFSGKNLSLETNSTINATKIKDTDLDMPYTRIEGDNGLYVAGNGDKSLSTVDGYMYAIPMFKVNRGNDENHSISNPYGEGTCSVLRTSFAGTTVAVAVPNKNVVYGEPKVGDVFIDLNNYKISAYVNKLDIENVYVEPYGLYDAKIKTMITAGPRCEKTENGFKFKFSNLLSKEHCEEMYHVIDTGAICDTDRLATETDKIFTGQDMKIVERKVYHYVPVQSLDFSAMFYEDFSKGGFDPYRGSLVEKTADYNFVSAPIGSALRLVNVPEDKSIKYEFISSMESKATLEFLAKFSSKVETSTKEFMKVITGAYFAVALIGVRRVNDTLVIKIKSGINEEVEHEFSIPIEKFDYWDSYRITVQGNLATVYVNSKVVAKEGMSFNASFTGAKYVVLDNKVNADITAIKLSSSDKGNVFTEYPTDTRGEYVTMGAGVRQVMTLSDQATEQDVVDIVKVSGSGSPWVKSSRTSGYWTEGDTIAVYGIGGNEIVVGSASKKLTLNWIETASNGSESIGEEVVCTIADDTENPNGVIATIGTVGKINKPIAVSYKVRTKTGNGAYTKYPVDGNSIASAIVSDEVLLASDEAIVTDDFRGKTQAVNSICPHTARWALNSTLINVNEGTEIQDYGTIGKDDVNETNAITNELKKKPQILLEFDLIKVIEKKFGSIKSVDKVAWIAEHLGAIEVTVKAKGIRGTVNKATMQVYNGSSWTGSVINNTNEFKPLTIKITNGSYISSDGKVSFIVYSDAVDDTDVLGSTSSISVSYAILTIKLKANKEGFRIFSPVRSFCRSGKCVLLAYNDTTNELAVMTKASDYIATFYRSIETRKLNEPNLKTLCNLNYVFATTRGTGTRCDSPLYTKWFDLPPSLRYLSKLGNEKLATSNDAEGTIIREHIKELKIDKHNFKGFCNPGVGSNNMPICDFGIREGINYLMIHSSLCKTSKDEIVLVVDTMYPYKESTNSPVKIDKLTTVCALKDKPLCKFK